MIRVNSRIVILCTYSILSTQSSSTGRYEAGKKADAIHIDAFFLQELGKS